ncbi:41792_t:CDS:2, partial [Gigaspora margarita]
LERVLLNETIQKKHTRELSASTEQSFSKKARKLNLKKANKSTTSIFLQLSNKINNAKTKNEDASQDLNFSYFDFGEAVFKQYKELKPKHGKDGSQALVKSKVREAISETKCFNEALRERIERSEKVYKLFN